MNYFEEVKDILKKDYEIDAQCLELTELRKIVISTGDETLLRKFEMNEFLYEYQSNIDYEEVYKRRKYNYRMIQKYNEENLNSLLEIKYCVNDVGVLLHIDGENKKIHYEIHENHDIDIENFVSSYITFSFNKDWGYMNFILTDYDTIVIDIIRSGLKEFYGYELKESIREIFENDNESEINKFTINLLKTFTLKINVLNIL